MVHLIKYASQSFWNLFEATKAISKGILLKRSIPILIIFLMSPKTCLFCQRMAEKNRVKDVSTPTQKEENNQHICMFTQSDLLLPELLWL